MSEPQPAPPADEPFRCFGQGIPLYERYHDEEWGRPVRDDRALYERFTLEAFQSGLAWITILRKREAFRAAFDGFAPERVAAYGDAQVARLMADEGIVRNGLKVRAAIANARALVAMWDRGASLADLVWSHRPEPREAPPAEVPAQTPESKALAKALKAHGFRFVGPTTAYAAMQACGLVNDHVAPCALAGAELPPLPAG